jgi:sigma-E factor negative regulatory protein RseC
MGETGIVRRIVAGKMDVAMADARPEACAKCRACEVFGQGKDTVLRVPTVDGVAVGDTVRIEIPQASPWTGIVFVLGLPVVLLAAGLLVGSRWAWWTGLLGLDADMCGILLGLPAAAAAFLAARWIDRRHFRHVTVTRIEPQA